MHLTRFETSPRQVKQPSSSPLDLHDTANPSTTPLSPSPVCSLVCYGAWTADIDTKGTRGVVWISGSGDVTWDIVIAPHQYQYG